MCLRSQGNKENSRTKRWWRFTQEARGSALLRAGCWGREASLAARTVKNPPAEQQTWVQSLGREDSPGGGHGSPLQCSCLEDPVLRGAWWAPRGVHGVAKSWT